MNDLQVSVEAREGLQRRLRVQVPAARIEAEIAQRLRNMGRSANLKGFRPGKVPERVIRQRYGGQVRQEVLKEVLEASYSEAIAREKLRPAGGPQIEPGSLAEGQDLTYTATFEIFPEFELQNLERVELQKPVVDITDADIDRMVDSLRAQRATWKPVEAAAADGLRVRVDFEGSLEGVAFEGGKGDDVPILLGAGQMLEDFEAQLIGLRAGDEKTFELTFPGDYGAKELAGKTASFTVKVRDVEERELPALDGEFAAAFGIAEGTVEALRENVRRNMEREAAVRVRGRLKEQVMDALLAANPIDVPQVMIQQEAESLRQERMQEAGIKDPQQAPGLGPFMEAAERRTRLGILLGTFISEFKVQADRERVRAKIEELCEPFDDPEEITKLYMQNPRLLAQVETVVVEDQVTELLLDKADIKDAPVSFDELMNA